MHPQLLAAQGLLYNKHHLYITHFSADEESTEYGACSFKLNDLKVVFRVSKITPTKIGQFVTLWKRNNEGITQPFDFADDFDIVIISSKYGDNLGQFILSKATLLQKGIISKEGKGGKRGIRVYPPWDVASNKQALSSQNWQTQHFISISPELLESTDLFENLIKV